MNKYKLEDYIPEEERSMLVDPNEMDDVPSVKLDIDENGTMRIQLSAFFHDKSNGKIPLLANNPALQEVVMKAIQIEAQKAFRKAVHGVLGIPYGLPENKTNKTMTNETKLWQLRAGLITESEYMEAVGELAEPEKEDPNVSAIRRFLTAKKANMKPIDTVQELITLVNAIIDDIQTNNKEALSDQEVVMGIRGVLQQAQKANMKPPAAPKKTTALPKEPPPVPAHLLNK